jgi:hypothetical protein
MRQKTKRTKIFLRLQGEFSKDLSTFDMILVPLLVNGNHWTVVLISNLTETITYINPMGTTQFALNNMLKRWNDFCSLHPILKHKNWSADLVNHEIQKDIVSCGIFIKIKIRIRILVLEKLFRIRFLVDSVRRVFFRNLDADSVVPHIPHCGIRILETTLKNHTPLYL